MEPTGPSAGVCLDVLLGQSACALIRIEDCRERTVGKAQRNGEALCRLEALRLQGMDRCLHTGRDGSHQPAREVYEVTPLAEQATTALLWIIDPVIVAETAGVDSDDDLSRMVSPLDVL